MTFQKIMHNLTGIMLGAMLMAPALSGIDPNTLSVNDLLLLLMLMLGVGFLFIGTKPNGDKQ